MCLKYYMLSSKTFEKDSDIESEIFHKGSIHVNISMFLG